MSLVVAKTEPHQVRNGVTRVKQHKESDPYIIPAAHNHSKTFKDKKISIHTKVYYTIRVHLKRNWKLICR